MSAKLKLIPVLLILFCTFWFAIATSTGWQALPSAKASVLTETNIADSVPLQDIVQIAAGMNHTCALTNVGGVKCWGANESGQLGNGSRIDSNLPVDVVGLSRGVKAIDAGASHSCALMTTGNVKCWGYNYTNQLGITNTALSTIPKDVPGLDNHVQAISTGAYHSCALVDSGIVKCWGLNNSGQLGISTITYSSIVTDVTGLNTGVIAVSAGVEHTCALTSVGGVKCWGAGYSGQLGFGYGSSYSPVDVVGLSSDVDRIALGSAHSCALITNRGVVCWGQNYYGQLGIGYANSHIDSPIDVVNSSGSKAVSAGGAHTCALTSAGAVKCWGGNDFGQVGNGSKGNNVFTPVQVTGLTSGIDSISAGSNHTCALTNAGTVKCWGSNSNGQLGNGGVGSSSVPVSVTNLGTDVALIGAGVGHSCVVTTAGGALCWGSNEYGQLGNGNQTNSNQPVAVNDLVNGVTAIAVGGRHNCALTSAGKVVCWGDNQWGQLGDGGAGFSPNVIEIASLGSNNKAITTGDSHSCVLINTGGIKCWGFNGYGQIGNNAISASNIPVNVDGLSGMSGLDAGAYYTCAVTSTGGVKCWGYNSTGQLGDGSTSTSAVPVDVISLNSSIVAVTAGSTHTCALTSTGGVKCWGVHNYGALGATSYTPISISALSSGVRAISAGDGFTCVLINAGAVKCWGKNQIGQLGDGSVTDSSFPVNVLGLESGVRAISAGNDYACAVIKDGVRCWGNNEDGQLGSGGAGYSKTPDDVLNVCYGLNLTHTGEGSDPIASPSKSIGCLAGHFAAQSPITFTTMSATGWNVASWQGTENDAITSTHNTLIMPTNAHTVTVNYAQTPTPTFTLTPTATSTPTGTSTPTLSPTSSHTAIPTETPVPTVPTNTPTLTTSPTLTTPTPTTTMTAVASPTATATLTVVSNMGSVYLPIVVR